MLLEANFFIFDFTIPFPFLCITALSQSNENSLFEIMQHNSGDCDFLIPPPKAWLKCSLSGQKHLRRKLRLIYNKIMQLLARNLCKSETVMYHPTHLT